MAEIARAGRARWKIENESFNCLSRHGYHSKHNFGHGSDGLANLLVVLNLLACAFHSVLDCLRGLWRQAPGAARHATRLLPRLADPDKVLPFPTLDRTA